MIARGTPGFSGADLANLVNEAALLAAREGKRMVTMGDFEAAKDKVMMGAERRSMVMTEEEKRLTAYHEAGHALVAYLMPASDPVHKATIIPRGRALGMVMQLPERDQLLAYTANGSTSRHRRRHGRPGRRGADLRRRRRSPPAPPRTSSRRPSIARYMVTQWGMSDELGPVGYGENQQEVFLGHSITQTQERLRGDGAEDRRARSGGSIEDGHVMARQILTEQPPRSATRWPRPCSSTRR